MNSCWRWVCLRKMMVQQYLNVSTRRISCKTSWTRIRRITLRLLQLLPFLHLSFGSRLPSQHGPKEVAVARGRRHIHSRHHHLVPTQVQYDPRVDGCSPWWTPNLREESKGLDDEVGAIPRSSWFTFLCLVPWNNRKSKSRLEGRIRAPWWKIQRPAILGV